MSIPLQSCFIGLSKLVILIVGFSLEIASGSIIDVDISSQGGSATGFKITVKQGNLNNRTTTIRDKTGLALGEGFISNGMVTIDGLSVPIGRGPFQTVIDGETFPGVTGKGAWRLRSDQQSNATSEDGGSGDADPPLGPPPSPFNFSPLTFSPGGLTFEKRLTPTNGMAIDLTLLDFNGTIEFLPTDSPEIFEAIFTQFEFVYSPFSFPGWPLDLEREILDRSASEVTGILDTSEGLIHVPVNTVWLDIEDNMAATAYTIFDVNIESTLDPEIVSIDFNSMGNVTLVPEPSTIALGSIPL